MQPVILYVPQDYPHSLAGVSPTPQETRSKPILRDIGHVDNSKNGADTDWACRVRGCAPTNPPPLCALRRPWQEEGEAGAVAELTFDPDPAAMRLNKAARDREPEARAARLAGAGPLAAEEAVEYVRQIG